MKPVFVINGFLESGKTEFISYTLAQPYFQVKGKTLLILCEEGENEYDQALLRKSRTVLEVIDEAADFTPERLIELEKKHKPERIVIEWNGMWNCKEMKLPWHWQVEQQVTTINGATFPMYLANMKSLFAEQVRKSELVIFNRCDGLKDLSSYKRNVRALNPEAEVVFEDADGEINEIMEEELPYDLKAPVIELDDNSYGIWYLDALDHMERYQDKTISFVGMVLKPPQFPAGYFVPGRMAMTCCADDMAFLGYACAYEGADALKERQWVRVTAKPELSYFEGYKGEGPLLRALRVEETEAPDLEVINFS